MVYTQINVYLDSKCTLVERIKAIDALIDGVLLQMINATETTTQTEYYLDNGQNKISLKYRSPDQIMNTIKALEAAKQVYVNRLNGRTTRLLTSKTNLNFGWPY